MFSIVVLIKGPEDVADVKGTVGESSPWNLPLGTWTAGLIALAVVAAALSVPAFRRWKPLRPLLWVTSLVCLSLAALAIAAGETWKTVVIVALGAAVALAGLSIIAGARAAYGPVFPATASSGGLLRTQQRGEVRRSRMWLMAGIYAALCAVVYIALAITVTWVKTPASSAPNNLLVMRTGQGPVCGLLEYETDNALFVRRPNTEEADVIARDDIQTFTAVASCPSE